MPPYGVFARYHLNPAWSLGLAYERYEFDYERPEKVLGIQFPPGIPAVDSDATTDAFLVWAERSFRGSDEARLEWFAQAGVGIGTVDTPSVQGPVQGGGTFDIRTNADTEVLALLGGGVRWGLTDALAIEGLVRVQHHFADWQLRDAVSGATGSIGDYTTWGGLVGLVFRF